MKKQFPDRRRHCSEEGQLLAGLRMAMRTKLACAYAPGSLSYIIFIVISRIIASMC